MMSHSFSRLKGKTLVLKSTVYFLFEFALTADRLTQLVEHRTTVREVAGSKLRPDQHSGSLNNRGETAAFVMTSAND